MKKSLRILGSSLVLTLVLSAGTVAYAADKAPEAEMEAAVTAESGGYTTTKVTLKGHNYDIPGILTMPTGKGPFRGVVMLHGTGSDKDEAGGGYAIAAPKMAEAGIATLRIDFIGTGDSKVNYSKYSLSNATSDANLAATWLAGQYRVDHRQIGVMGWSQGGTIALLAAGDNSNIRSVVTWAGAPDLSGLITGEGYAEAKRNGYSIMKFDWRSDLRLGLDWYEEVGDTDVLEEFSKSAAPVLAINGAMDTVVRPQNADKIVNASYNRYSETYLIPDCDHTFNVFSGDMTALNDTINETIQYFLRTLQY